MEAVPVYSRKRLLEDLIVEITTVWSCEAEGCKGWIRDNFAFEVVPTCPLCKAPMGRSMKELPLLVNTRTDQKFLKKGILIGAK
ncbi:MAG: hypothetical protein K0Q81_410 [Paenibacillus sp.]|jgi:hypothetical protein|nr:hypothetical protein [Paenibacillus sp.]